MKHRKNMTKKEREIRSKIHYFIENKGILRASILNIETKCGKKTCKCAAGQKHTAIVVEQSHKGKTKMRTVPKKNREQIRQWVDSYREITGLLEQLSEIHWQKLQQMKKK